MDPGVSWSRVRALPFFNMSHIRQLMQGNPVYGYGNRDFVNRDFVNADFDNNREDYDYDRSENMEDESKIRIPTFNDLLRHKEPETEGKSLQFLEIIEFDFLFFRHCRN